MKWPRYYLISTILACLLASCNIGGSEAPPEPAQDIPDKTSNGEDFMVCMVNNDLNVEVYREEHEMIFGGEEVRADNYSFSVENINIRARRHVGNDLETEVELRLSEDNPKPNTTYNISATYSSWRGEYNAAQNISIVRFSRIDSVVAAGEFVFVGISQRGDSMTFRGYFDIPFGDK